jgi:hypothetical protein
MRGGTRLDQHTPINELRYLAGLEALATTTPPCAHCEKPSAGKRNIGGLLVERCAECAAREEEHDLREQLGAQYRTCMINKDGAWHYIEWDGTGAKGNYTYDEALAMLASSSTRLRQLTALCERAERLGATIDYLAQRADGAISVIPPAGYAQTQLWCSAAELASLCDTWERNANGHTPPAQVYRELPDGGDIEALDIWIMLGDLLIKDPAALLGAARVALDSLADSPLLDNDTYEQISARISQARRELEGAIDR